MAGHDRESLRCLPPMLDGENTKPAPFLPCEVVPWLPLPLLQVEDEPFIQRNLMCAIYAAVSCPGVAPSSPRFFPVKPLVRPCSNPCNGEPPAESPAWSRGSCLATAGRPTGGAEPSPAPARMQALWPRQATGLACTVQCVPVSRLVARG
jgi:hypothetical protein